MRIASISSSRADVGILRPVWRALVDRGQEVHIILTGMHRAADAAPVALTGVDARVHHVGSDLGGRADAVATSAMADILAGSGRVYAEVQPDCVLAIGDRLDMLPAVVASLPFNLPIAHLHGGEITEGAIDDRVRHAITQLATLHLASCESAASRLRVMGVPPERVIVTGAPGLDTLREAPAMSRDEFLKSVGLNRVPGAERSFILATVHPETNSEFPQAPLHALLEALAELEMPVLFTAPNSDPGGAEMRRTLSAWLMERRFARFVETLGSELYPNALRHAAVMAGNSSSGIVEAGFFGLPVVDIGDRQKGRERGPNVFQVSPNAKDVLNVLRRALAETRREPNSIYGDGQSARRIASALVSKGIAIESIRRRSTP